VLRRLYLFTSLSILGLGLSAQEVTISGKITDSETSESLPYVHVVALPGMQSATSNIEGYFTLLAVPKKGSRLIFNYLGYRRDTIWLDGSKNLKEFNVELVNEAVELDVFEYSEESNQSIESSEEISKISINPAQLQNLPNLGEVDIFRSLQLLPGISGANESSSGLYVRGGTPDQNLILLDGMNIYHVDHFFGIFSAFNANAIKDVQVYKGGFEAKYGGRVSSVVDMTAKSGNLKKPAINVTANMLSANVVAETPLPFVNGSFLLAARRSYTDILRSPTYQSIFNNVTEADQEDEPLGFGIGGSGSVEPDFFFYDLNAKLNLNLGKKDVVSLNFFNSRDNLDNSSVQDFGAGLGLDTDSKLETTDVTKWGNTGTSFKWSRQWSPKIFNRVLASYSQYDSDYELIDKFTFDTLSFQFSTQQRNKIQDITLRDDLEWKLSEQHKLSLGLWFTRNEIDYLNFIDDSVEVQNQNEIGSYISAYAQDEWSPTKWLKLNVGMRFTQYDVVKENYFEPRLSVLVKPTKNFRLKAAWGRYNQFINRIILENIFGGSRDFWLLADGESIPVQSSEHIIVGAGVETKDFLIDVEAYQKTNTGLVEYSLRFGDPYDTTQNFNDLFFEGTGIVRGIEFLLQKKFGALTGWLAYTLSKVEYTFPGLQETPFPALHDQRNEVKLIGMYKWKRFAFSGTYVYATGKPYTAPVGIYEITLLNGYQQKYIHVGDKNSSRLPAYHRLDIGANYSFNIGKTENKVGISVFNVYNRKNIKYRRFQIQNFDPQTFLPTESKLLQTDVNLLGIVPNFFINIRF